MSLLTNQGNGDLHELKNAFGFQLTLPAVCHVWRKVALDTTALWTRVTIVNDPQYDLLELFLSRSGISPLDIHVHMDKPLETYDDEEAAQSTAEDIHRFLQRRCSSLRWRSFRLESTFPCLKSLDLVFTGSFSLDPHDSSLGSTVELAHLEFSEPQTQLQFLKIRGLFSPHVFGTSFHKHLTSLVHLELHFSGKYEWYDHDRDMPAARLLSSDPTSEDVAKALDVPKVHMPTLTTLSFLAISSPLWALDHLLTIDAPNLTTFELTFGKEPVKRINGGRKAIQQLVSYIATSAPVSARREPKSIFPSLEHLTFSTLDEYFQEDLGTLLEAYPQIRSLTLPKCSTLQPLDKSALELVGLKVGIEDIAELKSFLVARRKDGAPLRTAQAVRSTLNIPTDSNILKELEELVEFSLIDDLGLLGDAEEDD